MHRVVPELIIENFRAGRFSGEFPAVGMFLDLSGFSTMTDALTQHGQHGAEVLAGLMHGVFDPLVESIFEYGGKIVGFAGDGIMALYPIESDEKSIALRALASAQVIQRRLEGEPVRLTVYGKYPISAKIGLTSGSVSWRILRSDDGNQATYYFRGSAVDDSAEAEHHANAGSIILTRRMNDLLHEEIWSEPYASFHRFSGFRIEMPETTPTIFPSIDLNIARLFMPENVIVHDVRGEFRQVVNLFMRFPDLSDGTLQDFMTTVFRLRSKYGGLLTRLDFGDKGCNMLMLWGAPIAYENDIGRALNFVLDLQSKVDFPITAGVTYYIAHAGYLGSTMCEDYTCYGWGVNLASRFMMTAPTGQVWVDDRIARRVTKRFEIDFVGTYPFKGFSAGQKVHRLGGYRKTMEPIYQGELVGRESELERLSDFVEPLWRNKFAGLMLVSGDAGIGKGRLVHEFRSSDKFESKKALWAVCQSDQILRQSFNPLRSWLLRYFDIKPNQPSAERRQAFDSKMRELLASIPDSELVRELERTHSFLAALVDLYISDSLYEQLDAEGRYNNTHLALINLLKAESLIQPVILFLEDLQFTDDDTKGFLPRLKRAILATGESFPIGVVITSRPHGGSVVDDLMDERIDLPGLTQDALARLAEIFLGGVAASELVALLLKRSEGNPFFAEQIIRYLQEENLIEMSKGGWTHVKRLRDAFLPGDIRAILVARLDQLALEVKGIIQTASVLGREFEIQVLAQMLHSDANVREYVAEAEKAEIWAPLNEMWYIFSHGLLRDAAYSMQMRARRRELHALAVDALEHLYAAAPVGHYAELAYHAEQAEVQEKARKYYSLAGKASSELFQNSKALEYLTRALGYTDQDDLQMQFDLIAERIAIYGRIGNRPSQFKDLELLEHLARQIGQDRLLAKALRLRANYLYVIGDYSATLNYSKHAIELSKTQEEQDVSDYILWSLALLRLGNPNTAMEQAKPGLWVARNFARRLDEGRILTVMGLIALEQKDPADAYGYLDEALKIARELKERTLETRALNNLALFEGTVNGNLAIAREYYELTYRIAREIGDRYAEGFSLANLGFTAGLQGDIVAAYAYHEQSLSVAREIGNPNHEVYTLINLSAIGCIQQDAAQALKFAQLADELSRKIHDRAAEAWSMLYMGNAHLLMGNYTNAQDAFMNSVAIRNELGQPSLSMEPIAGLVETALQMNDLETASRETEKILAHFESGGTLDGTDQPLRVYHACYLALDKRKDPRAQQILQTADHLLDTQVNKFKDELSRKMYVENVPWRRALRDAISR